MNVHVYVYGVGDRSDIVKVGQTRQTKFSPRYYNIMVVNNNIKCEHIFMTGTEFYLYNHRCGKSLPKHTNYKTFGHRNSRQLRT